LSKALNGYLPESVQLSVHAAERYSALYKQARLQAKLPLLKLLKPDVCFCLSTLILFLKVEKMIGLFSWLSKRLVLLIFQPILIPLFHHLLHPPFFLKLIAFEENSQNHISIPVLYFLFRNFCEYLFSRVLCKFFNCQPLYYDTKQNTKISGDQKNIFGLTIG
jgi:hypothetical protein